MVLIKSVTLPKLKQHLHLRPGISGKVGLPEGVALFLLEKHRDKRGCFMEVIRHASLRRMGFVPRQISVSETRAGVIKAFHFHKRQADFFCPLRGEFRIVLLDARAGSRTRGHGYSIYTSMEKPFVLHIPPGVAHGYRVLGRVSGLMLYITNREYNPSDEHRTAWDDPHLGFPWHKR